MFIETSTVFIAIYCISGQNQLFHIATGPCT